MKRNYKSDFHFILKLVTCVKREDGKCEKREVGWPDHNWTAKLWTSIGLNSYVVSRKGDVLVNCFNDNGRIHVVCNNHKLGKGRLQCEFHAELPNGIFPDGIEDLYEPQPLDIELVDGPGDCASAAEVEVLLPYIKGDRGEKLTYADLTAQDKEDLIAPIKESIDKAITEKQDKLKVTADFDITENLLSLTDAGKRTFFNDLYKSAFTSNNNDVKVVHGQYDPQNAPDKSKPYRAYDDEWLSYEDALESVTNSSLAKSIGEHFTSAIQANSAKVLPPFVLPCGAFSMSLKSFARGNQFIEVVYFAQSHPSLGVSKFSSINGAFQYCSRLRKILHLPLANGCTANGAFVACYSLEEVRIAYVANMSFSNSAKLSAASISHGITYGVSGVTIIFHPDVYAKLIGDTTNEAAAALTAEELAQWTALGDVAAEKNIAIATT